MPEDLASHRRWLASIEASWPEFLQRREQRLIQQQRHGTAAEKVAENIVEDLFTVVLDWSLGDVNNQIEWSDILLTRLGIKYLLIETKRPGALAWNRGAVEAALAQARRYADEQHVKRIAVSDGMMFYAADIEHGGLQDRVFAALDDSEPPESLWWVHVEAIHRPRLNPDDAALRLLLEFEALPIAPSDEPPATEALLHPKYHVPAHCFGYIGDASDTGTWKLPYRLADGSVDSKRLPKAIQAILSNYRGVRVSGIPEEAIPDVLVRLACAAARMGKMPGQNGSTAAVYQQLNEVLEQLGRSDEVSADAI